MTDGWPGWWLVPVDGAVGFIDWGTKAASSWESPMPMPTPMQCRVNRQLVYAWIYASSDARGGCMKWSLTKKSETEIRARFGWRCGAHDYYYVLYDNHMFALEAAITVH